MGSLANISVFLAGLGIFFVGIGVLWGISIWSKQKKEK